ncbi:methyltransferase [Vibrio cholerae]|nr:class I SAM-dependent methyltransferase [Vibrio cholerae]EGR3961897.1 class I SAM-dependent methyltransferase [Vibrio cholerae]MBO1367807.1 methyltransferase [Vibrio cholerae]MBO1371646.1 methyltransferase [Vibrio cholerae]MBO1375168.1 methyltransferase [Vibrio cholerae]
MPSYLRFIIIFLSQHRKMSMRHSDSPTSDPYQVPANLVQPLWLRSRESLVDNGLVYDPIAANACRRCALAQDCLTGDIAQKQLLHVTLTQLCDQQVRHFLDTHPDGWIINVGAGLDTRFYRVDNGRCHWIEWDITENLLWREKLFHRSERYQLVCGDVMQPQGLAELPIPEFAPVLLVCEHALLDCDAQQVARFVRSIGLHFAKASACLVVAGDKTSSYLGQKLGCEAYAHGFTCAGDAIINCLPWAKSVRTFSPLDRHCDRWKFWQRAIARSGIYKTRLTPVVVNLNW